MENETEVMQVVGAEELNEPIVVTEIPKLPIIVQEIQNSLPENTFNLIGRKQLPSNRQFALAALCVLDKMGGFAFGPITQNEVRKLVGQVVSLTDDQKALCGKGGYYKWHNLFSSGIALMRKLGYMKSYNGTGTRGVQAGWEITPTAKSLLLKSPKELQRIIFKLNNGYYRKVFTDKRRTTSKSWLKASSPIFATAADMAPLAHKITSSVDTAQVFKDAKSMPVVQFTKKYGPAIATEFIGFLATAV